MASVDFITERSLTLLTSIKISATDQFLYKKQNFHQTQPPLLTQWTTLDTAPTILRTKNKEKMEENKLAKNKKLNG